MTYTGKNRVQRALLAAALGAPSLVCAASLYHPRVIVLTAFPLEFRAWQATGRYTRMVRVPGLPQPMICNTHRVCVAITGEGEINAAVRTTAIVRDPALDCRTTLFIRSGIAGGVQNRAALGSVYLANWIVSWGFGHHYLTRSGHMSWAPPHPPYAHNPWDTLAYRVAPRLLSAAYAATRTMPLTDSTAVLPLDAALGLHKYPHVYQGANVSGDDFWIGRQNQRIARHIVALYTHNTAHYATTAMEDLGDIAALAAFGLKRHYLSVRAVSDIDVPPPATSVGAIIAKGDEYAGRLAARNAYLVTRRVIAKLVLHRP
ncbi:phosphorylase [Acidiferrobacter sp.]|jgi:purine nucleoside permease|uniref:phosphorylase family protein n=1 Tax=Acidiferrobacter sp. TaxID=1872107 RepID=UPI002602904B|nr:phosphorylase [Acidiferrobacter sp.]